MPSDLVTVYRWRTRTPGSKRWRVLGWMMSEEDAAAWAQREGAEIQVIEGSAETRHDVDGRQG